MVLKAWRQGGGSRSRTSGHKRFNSDQSPISLSLKYLILIIIILIFLNCINLLRFFGYFTTDHIYISAFIHYVIVLTDEQQARNLTDILNWEIS